MRITRYFNCTWEEIKSRQFNIYFGISLGNKYFSKENLEKYLDWAFEHTKERILFVIADTNHAKNYEVFNKYSPDKALRHALKDGDKIVSVIETIISGLPERKRSLIDVVRWADLQESSYYKEKISVITKEFEGNEKFRKYILDIVEENLKNRVSDLDQHQKIKLSQYVLDEIPIMVNGIEYKNRLYNLYPYPGAGSYDDLLLGLQNKTLFLDLAEKLEITNRVAEIEAFVE